MYYSGGHVLLLLLFVVSLSEGQQTYVNNKQLDCYNHYNNTDGYLCNGVSSSCLSYLTFRSNPPSYDSAITIGYLVGAQPSEIATANNITDVQKIPKDTIVFIPVNCSCSNNQFYEHKASYTLKSADEVYLTVANNTYQGLTTCQAMMASNPTHDSRNLSVGLDLVVPLMCACPTANQTKQLLLLTYLVAWHDTISSISDMFGVEQQSILYANQLSPSANIYPFTPLLVPLNTSSVPILFINKTTNDTQPPPPPPPIINHPSSSSRSSNKWIFIGVGIGAAALLLLTIFLFFYFCRTATSSHKHWEKPILSGATGTTPSSVVFVDKKSAHGGAMMSSSSSNMMMISSDGIKFAIESLTVYKYDELEKATGSFSESNRIKGAVYRGVFKGDNAAIKIIKGDVSREINILKQINHTNIIRLSGFCVHDDGNTYLVYEYAENGSLADRLHHHKDTTTSVLLLLGWKERVQIAHDVADALNYLHNYSNPPYVHKNLKSSNILLDGKMRAKVANFGLARSVSEDEDVVIMTRHVVGTKGYMAPEYIENGLITPKLDVFAFGVLLLELLSAREPHLLSESIKMVLQGENVRDKLIQMVDPALKNNNKKEEEEEGYPLDLAYSLAQLANKCVSTDLNARPAMSEIHMTLSKILSSSLDWDPSYSTSSSRSLSHHVR